MAKRNWFLIAATLLLVIVLLVVVFQAGQSWSEQLRSSACPNRDRWAHPTQIHFAPGLEEHQSWILVDIPERYNTRKFVVCFDNRRILAGQGDRDTGAVRFYVQTRWVNAQWLLGTLNTYAASDRWKVGYNLNDRADIESSD